ncbi:MAG: DUF4332 domain-containing protein [Ekhidna sp.]
MSYYINLEKMTIEFFKEWLLTSNLIPSWMILRDNIDHLKSIKKLGIENLEQLRILLRSKSNLQEFASKSGLPEEYLNVLRRVINGFHPKPNRIKDFPRIRQDSAERLKKIGVTNTLQVYEYVSDTSKRAQFSKDTGLGEGEVDRLWKLTDLSRIKWVNHTFASMLKEAGYDSSEKVANADCEEMYQKVKEVNDEQKFYAGTIGLKDMGRCIEFAQMLILFK